MTWIIQQQSCPLYSHLFDTSIIVKTISEIDFFQSSFNHFTFFLQFFKACKMHKYADNYFDLSFRLSV